MAWTPPITLRRLILVTGDLHRTDWYQGGQSKPPVAVPDDLAFRWLRTSTDTPLPSQYATQAEALLRIDRGDACLCGFRVGNPLPIYHLWVTEAAAELPRVFGAVRARPGELLVYDAWVDRAFRGGRAHVVGAAFACEEALRRSRRVIVAGVARHEVAGYRRTYHAAGIGDIEHTRNIYALKLFRRTWHWERAVRA